jgi:hypothetical protein
MPIVMCMLEFMLAVAAIFIASPPIVGAQNRYISPILRAEPSEEENISAFSSAYEEWGGGAEAIIEEAFRRCFHTYIVDGRVLTLRMPFAQNNERSELVQDELAVVGGGKAEPFVLWGEIDTLLASKDFRSYVATLSDGKEKVLIFDLETGTWSWSRDWFNISRMNKGDYPGLPHRPFVLNKGAGVSASDVYNYVYCVGRLGMDCSGFVWYVLKSIARAGSLDLDRLLAPSVGVPRSAYASLYVGTSYFDPRNRNFEEVRDEVRNLKSGDIILFRDDEGLTIHSAVIQSVDLAGGRIRYLQATDEAPQEERGVHESMIEFDPSQPRTSLKDPAVVWRQMRASTFTGEFLSSYRNDGERYRSQNPRGQGTVVRLKALLKLMARLPSGASKPKP